MTLFDQMFLASEWRARTGPATAPPAEPEAHAVRVPTDQSNAVMETPEQTRALLAQLARGLGAYAARPMSEHDHRLALEAEIRQRSPRRA